MVVCDDSQKALQLMHSKTSLEFLVIIDAINENVRTKASELNIRLLTFEELKEYGRSGLRRPIVSLFNLNYKYSF